MSETDREDLKKKIEATGVHLSAHKELPYVYLAENLENVSELPGFAEGKFTVQDASSALAVKAAKIKPGDFVMDLCAAPGGKTILAAEYTKETGHVLSRDVSEYKTALILENLERMHRTNVKVEVHDATVYDAEREASADVVLMDDDPQKIAKAIKISRKCLRIVYENIYFALGIKAICLILGALGIANMWMAIFADVGVMVIAVLNAIRALFVKRL